MHQVSFKRKQYYFIRTFFFTLLYRIGFKISSIINEKILLDFLIRLRPYDTNINLIRLGESGDGGYLIPDDLEGIRACFTGGVGPMIGFEYDLAEKGINCFMADNSVEMLPVSHNNFYFEKKFIGTKNDKTHITFDDWFSKKTKTSMNDDFILKLDVEGDEYKILPLIKEESLKKMRIIILEIHHFTNVMTPMGFDLIKLIFDKLQKNHSIVHINPNNVSPSIKFSRRVELYDCLEITLLRNDRITQKKERIIFPHHLDSKNNNYFKSKLPDCFYKKY